MERREKSPGVTTQACVILPPSNPSQEGSIYIFWNGHGTLIAIFSALGPGSQHHLPLLRTA
jgi:hypothetical protein